MLYFTWPILYALAWHLTRANAQYYAITGTRTGVQNDGTRPFRRNIIDFQQNDQPGFNLYIQGLAKMQDANQNDQISWLQVAGIHGRPYVAWNNAQYVQGAPPYGYCTHSSPLFATWHRPYLALIEQVLARHIQDIAKTYPPSMIATYQAAADKFRTPYWDWASDPEMPPVTTTSTIQIVTPNGPSTVRNPLYSYRFPRPLDQNQFPPNQDSGLSTYSETTRQPVANVNSRLRAEGFQKRTWTSISKSPNFNTFSTSSNPGTSIESIHNSVHGDVNIHMGSLSYSSFDPIFWLHHANVDRLTALYQCINPDSWLIPTPEPQGTYTIRQYQIVSGATALSPFTSTSGGQYYTSDSSRYPKSFGYAYPEIVDWNQTPSQLQKSCTAHLNRLYNPSGTFFKKRTAENVADDLVKPVTLDSLIPAAEGEGEKEQKLRSWSVSVKVSKFDLPSAFIVRIFVGQPSAGPSEWFSDRGCVGSVYVNPPADAGGYYVGPQRDVVVHDEFEIEESLWQRGLDGQDVQETKAFLVRELTWRVQTRDGTVIPLERIKSLRVSVAEEMVTLAKSITELPRYGKKTLHPEITKDKLGGFQGTAAG